MLKILTIGLKEQKNHKHKLENILGAYWGYHLILDCHACHVPSIQSKENVYNWITGLVRAIDMEPIGEPRIEYTAAEFPDKAGFTAIQVIVTSSIVAHFVDSTGDVYIDVFSCKPFDNDVVEQTIQNAFLPKKIRTSFLTRQAG
jgi:S-adenosylmethionine/arginine decarboxylase-like enzyme